MFFCLDWSSKKKKSAPFIIRPGIYKVLKQISTLNLSHNKQFINITIKFAGVVS